MHATHQGLQWHALAVRFELFPLGRCEVPIDASVVFWAGYLSIADGQDGSEILFIEGVPGDHVGSGHAREIVRALP